MSLLWVTFSLAPLATVLQAMGGVAILSWNLRSALLLPALLAARLLGTRVLLWGHGYSKRDSWIKGLLNETTARLASGLVFYEEHTCGAWARRGFDPRKLFVARNTIDVAGVLEAASQWRADSGRLLEFADRQGIVGRDVLLYVGRWDPSRGLDLLGDALQCVRKSHPQALLVIVGTGDGSRYAAAAPQDILDDPEAARFLGPIYDENELAPWMLSAKVFCYPSNIGLSLIHAMAYGVPVVTSDRISAHGPEIRALKDGETGLLFRNGDARDLAAKINALLEDDLCRVRMSARAMQTVADQYMLSGMIEGMRSAVDYAVAEVK